MLIITSICKYIHSNKNGEVLIVTLRQKPDRFEQKMPGQVCFIILCNPTAFIHLNILSNPWSPSESLFHIQKKSSLHLLQIHYSHTDCLLQKADDSAAGILLR